MTANRTWILDVDNPSMGHRDLWCAENGLLDDAGDAAREHDWAVNEDTLHEHAAHLGLVAGDRPALTCPECVPEFECATCATEIIEGTYEVYFPDTVRGDRGHWEQRIG